MALYKLTVAFLRAYANLANEMQEAGYSEVEAQEGRAEVDHYEKVRQEVKLASGDYIDMKMYEPAMRHLLDTYIRAGESERFSDFDDLTLVRMIVERGTDAVESLPAGIRRNPEAVAETIENNVRRIIIDEMAVNPRYYEKMSELLDVLIRQRRQDAMDYKAYLAKVVALTKRVHRPETEASYPRTIHTAALRALFDNLEDPQSPLTLDPPASYDDTPPADTREAMALALDRAIRGVKKADWRENRFKEIEVRNAIQSVLDGDEDLVDRMFEIVKAQRDY